MGGASSSKVDTEKSPIVSEETLKEHSPLVSSETPEVSDQSPEASEQSPEASDHPPEASVQLDDQSIEGEAGGREGEEDEEEGECGFCLFMKGGGCKDTFVAWENCIEEVEKNDGNIAEKCFEVTAALKKCMDAHADYYEPILRAEKLAEAEAAEELEKEKGASLKDKAVEKEVIIEVEKQVAS